MLLAYLGGWGTPSGKGISIDGVMMMREMGPRFKTLTTDAFPWGAWPRDAAVDTHK